MRGAKLETAGSGLAECLPVERGDHESVESMLERLGVPLALSLLLVASSGAQPSSTASLQAGDAIVGVDGRLITAELAQRVQAEAARHATTRVGSVASAAAGRVLAVLREVPTADARELAESQPAISLPLHGGEIPSTPKSPPLPAASPRRPLTSSPKEEDSSVGPAPVSRTLVATVSLDALRRQLIDDAKESAAAEAAKLLAAQKAVAEEAAAV